MNTPSFKTLDLKAHRCPTAFISARKGIDSFLETAKTGDRLAIQTIEPSIERDLPMYLNSDAQDLKIEQVLNGDISQKAIDSWEESFDKEDWEDCSQHCFVLIKS
ncbi:hypothetical protein [Psychromonas sp. SP041]|uniref:hypothetical protein n=1 Tax=Psychromonas sp. SP041 TaxID=1365007 RepID=UPI0003F84168|nr:hypothetical protein [Psychromonas sp. SP041]